LKLEVTRSIPSPRAVLLPVSGLIPVILPIPSHREGHLPIQRIQFRLRCGHRLPANHLPSGHRMLGLHRRSTILRASGRNRGIQLTPSCCRLTRHQRYGLSLPVGLPVDRLDHPRIRSTCRLSLLEERNPDFGQWGSFQNKADGYGYGCLLVDLHHPQPNLRGRIAEAQLELSAVAGVMHPALPRRCHWQLSREKARCENTGPTRKGGPEP
jgi:hypothetical protein